MNDRSALDLLLDRGPLTRAELSELTGLSRPTTGQLLARLQASGAVVSDGHRTGRRGPNAELYRIDPALTYAAGVDVTPGRVVGAIADVTGSILAMREVSVQATASVDPAVSLHDVLTQALADAGLTARVLPT